MTLFISLLVLGYLMGSICSAVIVSRTFALPDPRQEGSKNPGATNVLRLAGKKYAALVMIVDLLKGTIPVLIAKALGADPAIVAFTALAAVVGHMYPIFFGFNGGKGVATAIGALLGLHFILGVMVAATWLLVANFSRYSSLASMVSISLAPFYSLLLTNQIDTFPPLFFIVILVLFKHRNNITRLIDGNEPKIKLKPSVIEDIMVATPPTAESAHEEPVVLPLETEKPKAIKKVAVKKATPKKESTAKAATKPKATKTNTKKAPSTQEAPKTPKPKKTKAKEVSE